MEKQTLWIARENEGPVPYRYFVYYNEPTIVQRGWSKGKWTRQGRLFTFCPSQIHKYLPSLKLKSGEKKQFTITV